MSSQFNLRESRASLHAQRDGGRLLLSREDNKTVDRDYDGQYQNSNVEPAKNVAGPMCTEVDALDAGAGYQPDTGSLHNAPLPSAGNIECREVEDQPIEYNRRFNVAA